MPAPATIAPARIPTAVPIRVTAPSAPGSTCLQFKIITGAPPNACPISDETVSAVASVNAARHITFIVQPIHASAAPEAQQSAINLPTGIYASGVAHKAATERFAITCEALRPRRFSASPASAFFFRPARVERNVSANRTASGVKAVRPIDPSNDPVQSVSSRQSIPPKAAAAAVAAFNIHTIAANKTLTPTTPSTKAGNRFILP